MFIAVANRVRAEWHFVGAEQSAILDELMSARFVDRALHQIYVTLLDEDRYLCSVRTTYRLLAAQCAVRERHVHPGYARPELLAKAPNKGSS